jgi:hypothetical protein
MDMSDEIAFRFKALAHAMEHARRGAYGFATAISTLGRSTDHLVDAMAYSLAVRAHRRKQYRAMKWHRRLLVDLGTDLGVIRSTYRRTRRSCARWIVSRFNAVIVDELVIGVTLYAKATSSQNASEHYALKAGMGRASAMPGINVDVKLNKNADVIITIDSWIEEARRRQRARESRGESEIFS